MSVSSSGNVASARRCRQVRERARRPSPPQRMAARIAVSPWRRPAVASASSGWTMDSGSRDGPKSWPAWSGGSPGVRRFSNAHKKRQSIDSVRHAFLPGMAGAKFETPDAGMEAESNGGGHDRPREKLARNGAGVLGDHELLALILGHGGAGQTAVEMATAILKEMGGIHGLTRVSPDRLTLLPGVGPAQSSRVLAAIELGRRTLLIAPQAKLPLRTPEEFASFLLPRFGAHSDERFGAVLLDSRHRFLRLHLVS